MLHHVVELLAKRYLLATGLKLIMGYLLKHLILESGECDEHPNGREPDDGGLDGEHDVGGLDGKPDGVGPDREPDGGKPEGSPFGGLASSAKSSSREANISFNESRNELDGSPTC